jgi:hypothetical protein
VQAHVLITNSGERGASAGYGCHNLNQTDTEYVVIISRTVPARMNMLTRVHLKRLAGVSLMSSLSLIESCDR